MPSLHRHRQQLSVADAGLGEGAAQDGALLAAGVGAVEDEVAEAVGDEGAAVALERLHGVRVVADDEGRAGVHQPMGEAPLLLLGVAHVLDPPVQAHDHQVGLPAGSLHLGEGPVDVEDGRAGGVLAQHQAVGQDHGVGEEGQPQALSGHDQRPGRPVEARAHPLQAVPLQGGGGLGQGGPAAINAVVVGEAQDVEAGFRQAGGGRRVGLEAELLGQRPAVFAERALQVADGEVGRLQQVAHPLVGAVNPALGDQPSHPPAELDIADRHQGDSLPGVHRAGCHQEQQGNSQSPQQPPPLVRGCLGSGIADLGPVRKVLVHTGGWGAFSS